MAAKLGITAERVRQIREEMKKLYGRRQFRPTLLFLSEISEMTGHSNSQLYLCIAAGLLKVSTSNTWTHRLLFTRQEVQRFAREGIYYVCPYCDRRIASKAVYQRGQMCCSRSECQREYHRLRRHYYRTTSPQLDELRSWYREFLLAKGKHVRPENEQWVTYKRAREITGFLRWEMDWIIRRGLLTTTGHPSLTWRGDPVRTFSVSELELARKVHEAWFATSGADKAVG